MSQIEFLLRLTAALERASIPYMLSGSLASSLHGEPRATNDLDIVIAPTAEQLDAFVASLGDEYYVSLEAAREALQTKPTFNVIDLVSCYKADLIIRKDRPFSMEEFARRCRIEISGIPIFVVSP